MNGSVAITDVPVPPLSTVGRFETLTHTVTICCLCFEGVDVGCHDLLAEVIIGGSLVDHEHATVGGLKFVCHVLIIGDERAGSTRGVPDVDPSQHRSTRLHRPAPI